MGARATLRRPLTSGPPAPGPGGARRGAPAGAAPPLPSRRACPIGVSGLAYAHPGGDLLFSGVSFRLRRAARRPGRRQRRRQEHAAEARRRAARPTRARSPLGGPHAYMPQDVGVTTTADGARAALVARPARLRAAGERDARGRARSPPGDERPASSWARRSATGRRSAATSWRASGTRPAGAIVGAGFTRSATVRATTLSGGERKQLVLDAAVRLRRRRPAARRARQLPRRPGQARARAAHPRVQEDDPADQPRPRAPGRRGATRSSRSRATAPGCTATRTRPTRRRASTARRCWATRAALEGGGAPAARADQDCSRSARGTRRSGPRRPTRWSRAGSASSTPGPPPAAGRRPARSTSACAAATRRAACSPRGRSASTGWSSRSTTRSTSASASG